MGVICFIQYLNGKGTPSELMESAQMAEENAAFAVRAEKHLQQALELHPQNEPVMEYLAGLYFHWFDPALGPSARLDDENKETVMPVRPLRGDAVIQL
ncbi:MAG: hypothetical protein JO185_26010 [Acidobacteriaceae bacterium]|nr:hypothetical protein [Acidobacteriaceae bacterium]